MSGEADTERNPYRMVSWANSGYLALLIVRSVVVIEEVFRIGGRHFSPPMMDAGIAFWGIGTLESWVVDRWSKRILAREIAKIKAKCVTGAEDQDE
ncbi:hypothetical protein [Gluconobacter roseus]|uniref:Uncharacterized protein n=1 Tax=Gluconobacter roseus NBRC 3990 TaxID=1307950 RepID=A0A4Y3M8E2_9PROT|nr:hypothetical protein [Gluconobacter roseus]KXV43394.1 hypothetical protein AD943_10710 [Gluconobacter roseus]GBR42206.1 hypothetical protein AA3990_0005 [Gluconobacter roseus NBRC 3990]GEB03541.1 hypothetical protein GRO01_11170 [Gluconobacter roseus NBRC 3990]GLP93996.1 hypothetical protein GCM10007871_19740 [Gluconobacter roseus NBRC 3990]